LNQRHQLWDAPIARLFERKERFRIANKDFLLLWTTRLQPVEKLFYNELKKLLSWLSIDRFLLQMKNSMNGPRSF